ncbi:GNAT family N-acetyltransferase, partial [Mycobacteroides abscessus subsp. abscessus]
MTEWVPLLDNRRQLQIRELIVEATRADGIAPVGEQVLRELRGTGAKHLVAEDGDDVAAFLNLVVPDEAASENATAMAELVVAPAARRRGIGSAMVREALAEGGAGTRVWA